LSRLVGEEAILYLMAFYLVSSIIFTAGIFNTYLPGQCYNSSSYSLEPCDTTPSPNMWGMGEEHQAMMEKYNLSGNASGMANPAGMLDPTKLVGMVGFYVGFMFDMLTSTYLTFILTAFVGTQWAHVIIFCLNICLILIAIRIVSGRIRWD
jgi:hypothetical protein